MTEARTGFPVALVIVLVGTLNASAEPRDETPFSPWSAAERLVPFTAELVASGWWAESGARVREAVEGEWEGHLRGGSSLGGSLGISVAWRRVGGDGSTPTRDRRLGLVWHGGGRAASVGIRVHSRNPHRALSVPMHWLLQTGSVVLGASLELHTAAGPGSPDLGLFATAARGAWIGGFQMGPRPEDYRGSMGIRIAPDLVGTVSLADLHPTYGLHLNLGSVELRVQSTSHRALGAVTEIRLVRLEVQP